MVGSAENTRLQIWIIFLMTDFFSYLPSDVQVSKKNREQRSKVPSSTRTVVSHSNRSNESHRSNEPPSGRCSSSPSGRSNEPHRSNEPPSGRSSFIAPKAKTAGKRTSNRSDYVKDTSDRAELIKFDGNLDILYIDSRIRKSIRAEMSSVKELYTDLAYLLCIAENTGDEIDKKEATLQSNMLRKRINDLTWGCKLSLYILRTNKIIDEYSKLTSSERSGTFLLAKRDNNISRKNELTLDYLRIAKEYIDIGSIKQKAAKMTCSLCSCTDFINNKEMGTFTCKNCFNITEDLDDSPSFKDSDRVNMSSRYTYTCRGHFIDAMNRFEGKQNTIIEESMLETLRGEMRFHKLTPNNVSKDNIYEFLSENRFSDYYADINLIYYKITGKSPPNITEYREELLEMLNQLEMVYPDIKDPERINSINVNWKLYKLLQLLDFPCRKDDFYCLKTLVKQGEHEEKWIEMIDILKNKYPKAKTSRGKTRWRLIRSL